MKAFLALALVLASQTALGADFFRCNGVGGVPEWTLEVNLVSKRAAFFDNDSWSVADHVFTVSLESNPPQTLHYFEGADGLEISFNETRPEGAVRGAGDENVPCASLPSASHLYSGI
jgi:hypothetical protein